MFTTGAVYLPFFSLMTFLIAVPTGVKMFNWIFTLWRGKLTLATPLLFALGFLSMFLIGGINGAFSASVPVDFALHDTYWVVAHLHYVLFGGSVFGVMAGLYYWFPKMTGRMLNEGLGKVHFVLMFIGFNLTFFPMHFVGLNGMPRRTYTYPKELNLEALNQAETVGSFILGLSFLVFLINIIKTSRKPKNAPADPWNGATLEWAIPSPPQEWNFDQLPTVHGRDPLWELKRQRGGALPEPPHTSGAGIHLPNPSYWPLVSAFGVVSIFVAIMMSPKWGPWGIVAAVALLFFGIYNWLFEKGYSEFRTPSHGGH
jgi:cytochrome c oxidase subunit 1